MRAEDNVHCSNTLLGQLESSSSEGGGLGGLVVTEKFPLLVALIRRCRKEARKQSETNEEQIVLALSDAAPQPKQSPGQE